ncbi:hypothetical protein ACJ41O_010622 [Fusarium nematophilum]
MPIKTIHRTTYPSISPSLPSLSTRGKSAVVTGGGSGIGAAIAKSFAGSGIAHLALLGRTEGSLLETKAEIDSLSRGATTVQTYRVDVTDAEATRSALRSFAASTTSGAIDILVANAGYMSTPQLVADLDPGDFWLGFDINVRGNLNALQAFHPLARQGASTVVHVSTGAFHMEHMDGFSGYRASKMAAYKLFEYYARENQDMTVIQLHPGLVADTGVTRPIADAIEKARLVPDDVSLAADFCVWAASDEARFLSGRFVWAAWDVDELKAARDEVEADGAKFTIGLLA